MTSLRALSYGQDLLAELATYVIHTHEEMLPDLTTVTVLIPSLLNASRFRNLLLNNAQARGHSALLGPEINTLSNWVNHFSDTELTVLTEHQRELMLVEALVKHPYLYGQGSPWALADSLLELFDELNERHIQLPENFDDFLLQLGSAYKLVNSDARIESDSLSGEAKLVHTLWQAWRKQLQDAGITDRHNSYLLKLANSLQQLNENQQIYLAGFSQFSPAESDWLKLLIHKENISLWLQGTTPPGDENTYHPDATTQRLLTALGVSVSFPEAIDDYSTCLNTIFETTDVALRDRAIQFAQQQGESPIASRLTLYEAKSAEQESLAIDLQTRRWWLEGKRKIGIVTENRRLARRVRALLERSGIELQDAAGWALSTTSAAATLERWLESVEEDFAYQPLLDFLKSPFFLTKNIFPGHSPNEEREHLLATVYRFEKSIILKENIGRSLERYRKHIRYRQDRLPPEMAAEYDDIYSLLEIIANAAKPLLSFLNDSSSTHNRHSPSALLDALDKSLTALGLTESFSNDDAGRDILEELHQMHSATTDNNLRMSWLEFRNWLGRTLERFNFQPSILSGNVQLMSLAQSSLCQFDGLIIAGAEREYLPGKINQSPFFNDGVRQTLGLASYEEQLSYPYHQFRRLLESAPNIVITRCIERNGEDVVISPWLERIQSFHDIAYNHNLIDKELTELVGKPHTIVTSHSAPLPDAIAAHPSISINSELLPKHISASAYQQLINCPYQFFAARCLGLEPPETIRDMLEKSDYGERVHLCLHAFHSDVDGLPGPFTEPLDEKNREDAMRCLYSIADTVFARDLEDNFLHRGWLRRWRELIPAYLDWQIKHQQSWQVKKTEANVEATLTGADITLIGRLDRIDANITSSESDISILDYKTGRLPKQEDVLSGESIQLPFYALLAEHGLGKKPLNVEYVSLEKEKVQTKGSLEGETLNELTDQVGKRLVDLFSNIRGGAFLTAWGDEHTCNLCQMSGVCRRESWLDQPQSIKNE